MRMARQNLPGQLPVREALSQLTVDDLRPLVALVGTARSTRKGDLVDRLAETLENPKELRALYQDLDDVAQKAVQEATYNPHGSLHLDRFTAHYGRTPNFGGFGRWSEASP